MFMVLDDLTFVAGNAETLNAACSAPALNVFSEAVLDLLDDLSHALRAMPECKTFPDLAAFAFWCRRKALTAMRRGYADDLLLGRGMALHIAPGNVPLNFAYSLAAGLLAGNANAVRLPSESFPQAELLCRALDKLLSWKHRSLKQYAVCFRCKRGSAVLAGLSALCAIRIIWGGDETIEKIRRLPLPPRAVELTFADRFSMCVIRSEAWLSAENKKALARRFFQDAYWSNQLACTAPRAVLWLGSRSPEARADFWPRISQLAREEYPMPDVMAVQKREAALGLAAICRDLRLMPGDNFAVRVEVPAILPEYFALCPGSGFFLECTADSLNVLLSAANEKLQTVTSYGVQRAEFEAFFAAYRPLGIDRVVPFGHSMDFILRWDGYDLIRSMSRNATIAVEE